MTVRSFFTVLQAKKIDLEATQRLNMSTELLMENAGIKVAEFVLEVLRNKRNRCVAVVCGKGNNAGDGLVVSRQLLCEGVDVDTFMLTPDYNLSPAAKKNLVILKKLTKRVWRIKSDTDLVETDFSAYDLLVDAIFGIGLKGNVGGLYKNAIRGINLSRKPVVSIDIPSGLDADKGNILGAAVKAKYTVTFIAPKRGLLINQGKKFCGRLIVRHIGFPWP